MTSVLSLLSARRSGWLSALGHSSYRHADPAPMRGFSLIELMIVVLIIAVLAAIAYPSYTRHVVKTHRVAAEGCLSEYANYMERYYTTNLRYDEDPATSTAISLPSLDCAGNSQTGAFYDYSLESVSATAFSVQAVPKGIQLARDTTCGTLKLDQTGTRTPANSDCW